MWRRTTSSSSSWTRLIGTYAEEAFESVGVSSTKDVHFSVRVAVLAETG